MTFINKNVHVVRIPDNRSSGCQLGCVFKLCKIRRLFIICGIIFCTFLTFQLIKYRPSFMVIMTNDSGPEPGVISERDGPGYFMAGKYPYNNTFCKFNYGLPQKLEWSQISVEGSPEHGTKSPYRVIYNAIERTMLDSFYTAEQVTYATHVTPEYLYHVVEIARFWDGPISVAAFVPSYDMDIAMRLLTHLCKCYDGMAKVSVHLVFPEHALPVLVMDEIAKYLHDYGNETHEKSEKVSRVKNETTTEGLDLNHKEGAKIEELQSDKRGNEISPLKDLLSKHQLYKDLNNINIQFKDCSNPDMSGTRSFRVLHDLIYPINVCRNVARNASNTLYNLVSDVELIPSEGLATRFIVMLQKYKISGKKGLIPKWKLAFVIPIFEVEFGEDVPRNKSSLQQLVADGKAVYFHRWVCSHCQKIPDLQNWMKEDPGTIIKPFLITKRQFPFHRWEPIYISTRHTPWYSETLSWEGRQDKMTQMLEMCLKSYDFVVVDGAFLCHSPGIKVKPAKHGGRSWRHRHELDNTKSYNQIVKSLAERYPPNLKCYNRVG